MNKIQTTTCTIELIAEEIEDYEIWDYDQECVTGNLDKPLWRVQGSLAMPGKPRLKIGPVTIPNSPDLELVLAQIGRQIKAARSGT